jgi:hypothetical protein
MSTRFIISEEQATKFNSSKKEEKEGGEGEL